MSDSTISSLPPASPVTPADLIPCVQAGVTKVFTAQQLLAAANAASLQVADYASLRSVTANIMSVYVTGYLASSAPSGIAGLFVRDDSDTTSADNGGTIIVASNGKRWKRSFNGSLLSVAWFGAKGDGVTDDTSVIQAAANVAAGKTLYFPATSSSYLISVEINLSSNTIVRGEGQGSAIQLSNGNKSGFSASGKTDITVRDLLIFCQSAGTTAYIGGVMFFNCTKCTALNLEVIGMSWAGVLVWNSNQCRVQGCRFSGWLGSQGDSSDIAIFRNSNFNVVEGNHCYGGGYHGILLYDDYSNTTPTGNIVNANVVDQHTAYGIMLYTGLSTTPAYNSRTVVSNNVVSNVLGSAISGASGAGIYIQGGGGTVVSNNTVYNCCQSTTNFDTLGMAGIALQIAPISQATGSEVEIVATGNNVHMLRGPCLWATAATRAILVSGNNLKNTGTAAVRGEAAILSNVMNVKFSNNTIRHENSNYAAVRYTADTNEYSQSDISGNIVSCVNSSCGILVNTTNGGSVNYLNVSGNTVFGTLANPAYQMAGVGRLRFFGNHGKSTGIVFLLQNCPRATLSNNTLSSSYSNFSIIFTGAANGNAGMVVDETNMLEGLVEHDSGTGGVISQYGSGTPSTWLNAVGDRVVQSVPVVGNPKGWRCTVAGAPGTWVSEGNL